VEVFGAVVTEFVAFVGFNGDDGASIKEVSFSVDAGGEGAGQDEEDFGHVVMGMGGGDLAGFEDGVGELGEIGDFAIGEQDLFFDICVVGNFGPGELGLGFEDHGADVFLTQRLRETEFSQSLIGMI